MTEEKLENVKQPKKFKLKKSTAFFLLYAGCAFLAASFAIVFMLCFFAFAICALCLLWSIPSDYAKATGWDCKQSAFETEYYEAYIEKIEELEDKYDLSFGKETKWDEDNDYYKICLYAEEYYICFGMTHGRKCGWFDAKMVYYTGKEQFSEDFDIDPVLNFLNDFVNFAGYDTKTDKNYFVSLYTEMLENGSSGEVYKYHWDDYVGYVEYDVHYSGYSRAFGFYFDGLLKPLN